MKRPVLRSLTTAVLLCLAMTAQVFAQPTTTPKYTSLPDEKYFDFGDEPIRFVENDRVKLGFNLAIGGAVVYLEDKANNSGNMINSYDWGRQIQLSYYSGPTPFIGPNGEKPSDSWAGLGWNPIQAGDCDGYGSRVLNFRVDGNEVFIRTRPMLWPNIGLLAECLFECRYTLTDNGFELVATIINNRSDKTQYPARNQETPALYTNAPWYKLVSYLGDKPFENEPATVIVDKNDGKGWPWVSYYTPERWSALVNEENYGVGVYQPYALRTSAGFAGGDEPKGQPLGEKAGPTGYIAPREVTILDWNIKRSYKTTFIVGSLDEIRSTVYKLAKRDLTLAPEWNFIHDRNNWTYVGTTDDGCELKGNGLTINLLANNNAVAKSPETFWKTENGMMVQIDGRYVDGDRKNAPDEEMTLIFTPVSPADTTDYLAWSEGEKNAQKEKEEKAKDYPSLPGFIVKAPVQFHEKGWSVLCDLSDVEEYKGAMRQLTIVLPAREGKINLRRVFFYTPAR